MKHCECHQSELPSGDCQVVEVAYMKFTEMGRAQDGAPLQLSPQ